MARTRRDRLVTTGDMPDSLSEYRPSQWPPELERVDAMAPTFGRTRMAAIVSRAQWHRARLDWLAARGLRTSRDIVRGEAD